MWAIARTNNEEMKREATALLESFGRFSYTNVMPLVLAGYIDENATETASITSFKKAYVLSSSASNT